MVFAVGCSSKEGGKKPTELTGTVTYKGNPVGVATIAFINEKGEKATGSVYDGKFKLASFVVGDVKVTVDSRAGVLGFERLQSEFKDRPSPVEEIMGKAVSADKYKKDEPVPEDIKANWPPEQRMRVEQYEQYQKLLAAHNNKTLVATPTKYESADTTPLKIKITSEQKDPIDIVLED